MELYQAENVYNTYLGTMSRYRRRGLPTGWADLEHKDAQAFFDTFCALQRRGGSA